MGKGARRRARKARAGQRPDKGARRVQASARRAELLARTALILSPEADPKTIATQLAEHVLSNADVAELAAEIVDRQGPDRARAIADELLEATDASPSALVFAARLMRLAGDDARSAELLERLWDGTVDPSAAVSLAGVWTDLGRCADALELLWEVCARDPMDLDAQQLRGEVLAWMATDLRDPPGPHEQRWVDGFTEREDADRLTDHAIEQLHGSALKPFLDEGYERWYGSAAARHRPAIETPDAGLLMEWLLVMGIDSEDDDDCLIARIANDPATPPELARRARDRHEHGLWGLWEVREHHEDLGAWVIELMTGLMLYVDPGERGPLPAWTVLLGPAYPDEGVWRLGMCEQLSPREAEALQPLIAEVANTFVAEVTKGRGRKRPPKMRHDPELPATVRAELFPEPETAPMMSAFAAGALPELMETVREWRATPPEIRNSDGDPVEVFTLEIDVDDPDAVRAALRARPDIDAHDDEFVWEGREVPAAEAALGLAEMRARGHDPGEVPQHYVRAVMRFDGPLVRAEVNSRARRDDVLRILDGAAARPRVRSETRIDPALDLPTVGGPIGGPRAGAGMSKEAIEAWQRAWVDEQVPALDGLTPREASRSKRHLARLVALLRQIEHQTDPDRLAGRPAPDVEQLRTELLGHLARD